MSDEPKPKTELTAPPSQTTNVLPLGTTNAIDISKLSPAAQEHLQLQLGAGLIDSSKRAQDLAIDNQALAGRLSDLTRTTADAANAGAHVTMTGAYTDKLGTTQIKVGNTKSAEDGQLSRSQTGEKDHTLLYVIIAAVVIVLITSLVMKH